MADIRPFRRPDRAPRERKTLTPSPASSLSQVFEGLEVEGMEVDIAVVLLRIESHITSLRGRVSLANIAERRRYLKNTSLEELEGFARNSESNNWSSHPPYYLALVYEIRSRAKP